MDYSRGGLGWAFFNVFEERPSSIVVQAADGSLLISDDDKNRIYRLRWAGVK